MTPAAAQPVPAALPPEPHNVTEGFALVWQKLDA